MEHLFLSRYCDAKTEGIILRDNARIKFSSKELEKYLEFDKEIYDGEHFYHYEEINAENLIDWAEGWLLRFDSLPSEIIENGDRFGYTTLRFNPFSGLKFRELVESRHDNFIYELDEKELLKRINNLKNPIDKRQWKTIQR